MDKFLKANKKKNIYENKNVDPHLLLKLYRERYGVGYFDSKSIVDGKATLDELRRVRAISCENYNKWHADRIGEL